MLRMLLHYNKPVHVILYDYTFLFQTFVISATNVSQLCSVIISSQSLLAVCCLLKSVAGGSCITADGSWILSQGSRTCWRGKGWSLSRKYEIKRKVLIDRQTDRQTHVPTIHSISTTSLNKGQPLFKGHHSQIPNTCF